MRLMVYPFENFVGMWYHLICFVWPDYRLEIFVVSNWRGTIPYRLESVNKSHDVLAPVWCVELVSGTVHQDVREAICV